MSDDDDERKANLFWIFWAVACVSVAIGKLTDTAYGVLTFGCTLLLIFIASCIMHAKSK